MKTSLKKITLAVLPLVAFLLIAPSSALAKRKHNHHDHDSYSRYDNDDRDCRDGRNRHSKRHHRNRDYGHYNDGRYHDGRYRDDRYYGDGYSGRRSRSPYTNDLPPYYGSPYGNPSSYDSPTTGALPWLDILLPRY